MRTPPRGSTIHSRSTTKTKANLGFGTAPICSALDRRQAIGLLNVAYDAGIRHFDTAPLYGWGAGETVMSAFARGKSDLTIVTKAGIDPPSLAARIQARLRGRIADAQFNRFSVAQVRRSAEASLSRLKVECLGALLLHEPDAGDVTDDLLKTLEELKRTGKTAAIGLAGAPAVMAEILTRYPGKFDIVQTPLTGIERVEPHAQGARLIVHSVLNPALDQTLTLLAANRDSARPFETETGVNHDDRAGVARLLLSAALARVPDGITLFSSSKAERIRSNARLTPSTHPPAKGDCAITSLTRHARRA